MKLKKKFRKHHLNRVAQKEPAVGTATQENQSQQPNVQINIPFHELTNKKLFVATPMYGGMCYGNFTRSMMDLSALCHNIGIPLATYFLMNESLIQRARNYCCEKFMESDATHMLFIDSDIAFDPHSVLAMLGLMGSDSPYDVLACPYPKKCSPANSMIETEDGLKTMKWVVDNEYVGKVKTLDSNGRYGWNRVISHSSEPNILGKKWVKVGVGTRHKKALIVTEDHECAVVSDVLNPKIEFVQAKDMVGKYSIRVPIKNSINPLYNKEQLSAIVGCVLGDGSLSKKDARLTISHTTPQVDYLKFKGDFFGGKVTEFNSYGYSSKLIKRQSKTHNLSCPLNDQLRKLRELSYVDGKKTVKDLLPLLDEISLAFWYMDDGCLKKSGQKAHYIELNTQGFSDEDQGLICDYFRAKFGFSPRIDVMSAEAHKFGGKKYKRIRLLNDDSDKFLKMVAPFVVDCMNYKLPQKYKTIAKHSYNMVALDYAAVKVIEVLETVDPIYKNSRLYDIGVEHNHNYVANQTTISNCVSWEKIKKAVDKGFADKDPNDLSKYVGDFVFNPVPGTVSFNIYQPVEVLEAGTGFMMIKRQTFDKYKAAYPNQSYKPDHVRTKEFDGSKEIHAYFDCIIDPDTKRYLSEDYMFCQYVRKMGGKVALLPWVKLEHTGTMAFGGSVADLAKIGASATADPNELEKYKDRNKP